MYTSQSKSFTVPVVTPKPRPVYSTETAEGGRAPEWALVGTRAKKRRAYGQPRITDGRRYPVTTTTR